MSYKRAIVYMAWGEKYITQVIHSITSSQLPDYPVILITDESYTPSENDRYFKEIIPVKFHTQGLNRKSEMVSHLPTQYDSFLYLDADTIVMKDISLGFTKAEQFGVAIAPAPHYSLDHFFGFKKIMEQEQMSGQGQLQYNTGVIFFAIHPEVVSLFNLWKTLIEKYGDQYVNDQPFFTMAMEQIGINPYTLSPSYNYRSFGELISGDIKIWHSYNHPPAGINAFKKDWPMRVEGGRIRYFNPYRLSPIVNWLNKRKR